jgi:hypothetical protein
MMDSESIRIARRIVAQMLALAEQGADLALFQGYGLCLAICYEEMTGRTALDKKPRELMEWAKNLPDARYRKVDAL